MNVFSASAQKLFKLNEGNHAFLHDISGKFMKASEYLILYYDAETSYQQKICFLQRKLEKNNFTKFTEPRKIWSVCVLSIQDGCPASAARGCRAARSAPPPPPRAGSCCSTSSPTASPSTATSVSQPSHPVTNSLSTGQAGQTFQTNNPPQTDSDKTTYVFAKEVW